MPWDAEYAKLTQCLIIKMTKIMKTYNSPMLQVVSIKNNDILTNSPMSMRGNYDSNTVTIAAPGQRGLDDWDAGY